MGKSFEKPFCEVVRFTHGIIMTSGCGCNIGGVDFPGCNQNYCTGIDTYCSCQTNFDDPDAGNCVLPG